MTDAALMRLLRTDPNYRASVVRLVHAKVFAEQEPVRAAIAERAWRVCSNCERELPAGEFVRAECAACKSSGNDLAYQRRKLAA